MARKKVTHDNMELFALESPADQEDPKPKAKARSKPKAVVAPTPPPIEETEVIETLQAEVNEEHIYSVSEITKEIKQLMNKNFVNVAVEGEISNWKVAGSGHAYFSIKDGGAQLSSILFRARDHMRFEIEDGMQVVLWGRVDVYEPRGSYSLIVQRIEPKGYGALQLQFEQLKKKLAAEGLFDDDQKLSIPFFPRKIAVVTSPTGAAIRDFINVSTRRFPGVQVMIAPVRVQGEGSASEIAQAISQINHLKKEGATGFEDIDVLIVTRGGGSIEDLWAFNEEEVARALSASIIPTISAVGHEVDFTIADFVADKRAPTPSAAAELAVPDTQNLQRLLHGLSTRTLQAMNKQLQSARHQLNLLWKGVQDPRMRLQDLLLKTDDYRQRIETNIARLIKHYTDRLAHFQNALRHLNPLNVLERGYSITFDKDGRAIKTANDLNDGQELRTRLWQGEVISEVKKLSKST